MQNPLPAVDNLRVQHVDRTVIRAFLFGRRNLTLAACGFSFSDDVVLLLRRRQIRPLYVSGSSQTVRWTRFALSGRAHLQRRLRVQPVFLKITIASVSRRFSGYFLQHGVVFLHLRRYSVNTASPVGIVEA